MIGRADIEGSKSNVAMNAWLPQASYPCGNFSDTPGLKLHRKRKSNMNKFTFEFSTLGIAGPRFRGLYSYWKYKNQGSFYPYVLHEISVLVELPLGHLRYRLTDVPPQPNSPPDYVVNLGLRVEVLPACTACTWLRKTTEHTAQKGQTCNTAQK